MTQRKNQNSILVLATLGVYLGLVLAGATPQILAQAAMTREFSIKDESKKKDGLDKKPNPAADGDLFADAVADLVYDLDRLSRRKEFSWGKSHHVTIEDLSFCESDNSPAFLGSGEISDAAQNAFDEAAVKVGRGYFRRSSDLGVGDYHDGWPIGVSFDLITNPDGLLLNIKFVTSDSAAANSFFRAFEDDANKPLADIGSGWKIVLEHTRSKVSDSSILLVIHLPRAGIDSIVAARAK